MEIGEYCYLLDQLIGLAKHARISEDAEARILEKAFDSSYRKGGINACIGEQEVSKKTVIKKLHALDFPKLKPINENIKLLQSLLNKNGISYPTKSLYLI
jgi:hypothetical protein